MEWSKYEGGVWLGSDNECEMENPDVCEIDSDLSDSDFDPIAETENEPPDSFEDAVRENLKSELKYFQKSIVEFNFIMKDLEDDVNATCMPGVLPWGESLVKLDKTLDAKTQQLISNEKITIDTPKKDDWWS
jgi:hypothetical protein